MLAIPFHRLMTWVVLGGFVGGMPGLCRAEEHGSERQAQAAAGDERGEAKRLFDRGREHFAARRYRDAIHAFELAYALWPMPDLLFNIGRAYEELGDGAAAVSYFERYLRDSARPSDATAVRARIARLTERMRRAESHRGKRRGSLRLAEAGQGATAWLDGQVSDPLASGELLFVSTGDHRLRVERADGRGPLEAVVQVRPGETTTAIFGVETAAPATDRTEGPGAWVVTGAILSAAFAAGAATTAAVADTRDGPTPRLSVTADALLGTGLLTALVSTVVYFAEGSAD